MTGVFYKKHFLRKNDKCFDATKETNVRFYVLIF